MTTFDRTEHAMMRLTAGLALLGSMGLIFATIATCLSIVLKLLRRTMDALAGASATAEVLPWLRPILGEEELVAYGVGFALFAALPWVMIRKGHIRIDLCEPVFGKHFNKVLDFMGDVLLATIAYHILTRQWFLIFKKARGSEEPLGELLVKGDLAEIADRVRSSQESQILGVPLWPTYVVAEFCILIFFIVALFCVWRSLRALFDSRSAEV